ncbi:MAG: YajQ family cyclic di-GMP-binding protein [Sorangiineae bacterium]|nr:YajQ family cyclic di-GMP-binding protein [Polyangiaceae bacterium]MEB2323929.1 YajQ family cyclic di-GMP-binding protein [Sorangiineae bacterium]
MPSFDVVSKVNQAEVSNALDQAQREVAQRYDFKGTDASLEKTDEGIVISANAEDRARAALDVLEQKLIRRKVSLKHLEIKDPEPGPRGSVRLRVLVKEGIETDKARALVKLVKDSKLKVQASIQGDAVRITGKQRDELQAVIALLRAAESLELDLSFENFRD